MGRLAGLGIALLLTLVNACSGDTTEKTTTASSTPTPPAAGSTFAQKFDIGGGRNLFLSCRGEGSPTVLFEAGDEDSNGSWFEIQDAVSDEARACAYDRAGVGSSDDASGCRGLDDILDDLEALLDVAQVEPPYLLVGASGGGFLAAGFAARHPADVAGMVLLETPRAITNMPPGLKEQIACDNPSNIEHRDYYAVEHAVWDHRRRLGDFPLRIVSNDYGSSAAHEGEARNVADQRGWRVLSSDFEQHVVTSGHDVVLLEPELALRLIREVLDES